jgi:hypothetical protein
LQRDADAPQFIYWVTLNSHLPVPVSNGVKAPPACSDNSSAAKDPAICAWYQLVFNVHRSVSQTCFASHDATDDLSGCGRSCATVLVGPFEE